MKSRRLTVLTLAFILSVPAGAQKWIGTWAASPMSGTPLIAEDVAFGTRGLTVREVIHVSLGGNHVRLSLTNEFGKASLTLSDVHLQQHGTGGSIVPSSDHAVKFNRSSAVTIAPGQFVTSDPVNLPLANNSDLVVSFYVPQQPVDSATFHALALATSYISSKDETTATSLTSPIEVQHWYFVKDVQVDAPKHSYAVVTFGDSITDGARSTPNANQRWPDLFSIRLLASSKTEHVSVLNEGISGNRLLSALDRLDRDVLNAPGAKYIILLAGINDIGRTTIPVRPDDPVTAEQILDGYKQIIQRAHAKGIKVIGATLTPYMNATYWSTTGEQMRQTLNAFILQPGNFDGAIDFDEVLRDPQQPTQFLPSYNNGDHLHPNDAGYAAMADAIDLSLFH